MYKIFFKDRAIILTSHIENDLSADFSSILKYANQGELQHFIDQFYKDENMKKAYIYHHNLHELFQNFKACFKNLPAAGGLVWNKDKTMFLGMKRLGYFDLPKGKIEPNETTQQAAIREVEEECKLNKLTVNKKLCTTFHTYILKNKYIFKETSWFDMSYHGSKLPKPQTEENIESVFWVDPNAIDNQLANTYPSIIEVLKSAAIL